MYKPKFEEQKFVWNSLWVSHLDSPWSVYFKFIYANHIRASEFIKLTTGPRSSSAPDAWKSIDLRKIDAILGTSVHVTWNNFTSKLVHPFSDLIPDDKLIRQNMHFCPRCLPLGIHAPYNQSVFVNRCPFHDSWLIPGCPECGRWIPFAPSDHVFYPQYKCTCGYPFPGLHLKLSFPRVWKEARNLKIIDDNLQKWLDLTPEKLKYFRNRLWLHPQTLVNEGTRMLGDIANFLNECYNLESTVSRSIPMALSPNLGSRWLQREHCTTVEQEEIQHVLYMGNQELTYELRQVFKSVIRNIRKHTLGQHRKCVKHIVRGKPDIAPCPAALAYVLSRMLVEGHPSPRSVENGASSSRFRSNWPLYSEIDHNVLTTLMKRHTNRDLGQFNRFNEVKTVFGHIVLMRFKAMLNELQNAQTADYHSLIEGWGMTGVYMVIAFRKNVTLFIQNS